MQTHNYKATVSSERHILASRLSRSLEVMEPTRIDGPSVTSY